MWIKVTKTNARREIKLWKRGKEKKGQLPSLSLLSSVG